MKSEISDGNATLVFSRGTEKIIETKELKSKFLINVEGVIYEKINKYIIWGC